MKRIQGDQQKPEENSTSKLEKTLTPLLDKSKLKYNDLPFYQNNKEKALEYATKCATEGNINDLKIFILCGIFKTSLADDISKRSILSVAISAGKIDVVDFLTHKFPQILNLRDDNCGNTPIMQAVKHGQSKILELLCKKGADLTIKDNFNFTPISIASKSPDKVIFRIISDHLEEKSKPTLCQEQPSSNNWEDLGLKQETANTNAKPKVEYNESEWVVLDKPSNQDAKQDGTQSATEPTTNKNSSFASSIEKSRNNPSSQTPSK